MAEIVSSMKEGSLVLFNESFSATNVRRVPKIAWEIIDSLLTCGTKVVFVTHNYDLTNKYLAEGPSEVTFLQLTKNSDVSPAFMLN